MLGKKPQMALNIPSAFIEQSITDLKASTKKEKVLLWLGKRTPNGFRVEEVFTPIQVTDRDYFIIPKEGMQQLMNKLRVSRRMIVAQIHTHPGSAYHSTADDTWAVVRHHGAYSLVLPTFASNTTFETFFTDVATFVLNEENNWIEVSNENIILS